MFLATFIAQESEGFVDLWGYHFPLGEPVKVTDPHAIRKIMGNPTFRWEGEPIFHDEDKTPDAPAPTDDVKAIRAEYAEKFGKKPFPGWSADVLREKLATVE